MSHRSQVGGMWDEIGKLQFSFMVSQGLQPHHKLLDIGCGCLRGGVHFIEYLDSGNYYGLDKDDKLLAAGMDEVIKAGIDPEKKYYLKRDQFFSFNTAFNSLLDEGSIDYAIAQSLFTHLNLNEILLCLVNVRRVLKENGKLFATFFNCQSIVDWPNAISCSTDDNKTVTTRAAFARSMHYTSGQLMWAADWVGLRYGYIGEWGHPRKQEMAVFYR